VPGIYLKQGDGDYIAMTETAYDAENVLQRLIARHPEMLSTAS
jgi:nitrous oxidase accessory protein NosD